MKPKKLSTAKNQECPFNTCYGCFLADICYKEAEIKQQLKTKTNGRLHV